MEIIEQFGFALSAFEANEKKSSLTQDTFKRDFFFLQIKVTENKESSLQVLNLEHISICKGINYAYRCLPFSRGYTIEILNAVISDESLGEEGLFAAYIGTITFWRAIKYNANSSVKPYFDIQNYKIYYPKPLL